MTRWLFLLFIMIDYSWALNDGKCDFTGEAIKFEKSSKAFLEAIRKRQRATLSTFFGEKIVLNPGLGSEEYRTRELKQQMDLKKITDFKETTGFAETQFKYLRGYLFDDEVLLGFYRTEMLSLASMLEKAQKKKCVVSVNGSGKVNSTTMGLGKIELLLYGKEQKMVAVFHFQVGEKSQIIISSFHFEVGLQCQSKKNVQWCRRTKIFSSFE